jgi:hypothetical protein
MFSAKSWDKTSFQLSSTLFLIVAGGLEQAKGVLGGAVLYTMSRAGGGCSSPLSSPGYAPDAVAFIPLPTTIS